MAKMTVLSARDIERVFTVDDALTAVEEAYRQKAVGLAKAWPMVYEEIDPGASDMDIRSGILGGEGLFGLKLTSWAGGNPQRGLPDVFGTTLVCESETGEPRALLNASAITGLRTGAAAALGVKWLAREDVRSVLVAGAGHMCPFVVAATLAACPTIERVTVYDPLKGALSEERLSAIQARVRELLAASPAREACDCALDTANDGAACAQLADAVITVTPATVPFVDEEWIHPGLHLSCVGADMPGKQEVASAVTARACLFADDRVQSVSSGELEVPAKEGAVSADDIKAELGEVIAGTHPGRSGDEEVTLFDTSGIAVQDLAASKVALVRALEAGLGQTVEL